MTYLRYGFVKTLAESSFENVVDRVIKALKEQGFGVLTEIDVQRTLKEKLDADFRRYTILGACNPALAKQALEIEEQIGLLLPCNVVVQEGGKAGIIVSIADPREMFSLVDNTDLAPVAREAGRRLHHVMAALD